MATSGFRGFVLGVSAETVVDVFRARRLTATTQRVPPPASLALGVPRRRLLRAAETPQWSVISWKLALVAIWAGTGALSIAAIVAWFAARSSGLWLRLAVTAGLLWAIASVVSLLVLKRLAARDPRGTATLFSTEVATAFSFGIGGGGEGALIVSVGVLAYVIVVFVLFVVWLPGLLVVVGALTLGALWRTYRTVLVDAHGGQAQTLGLVGRDLVHRGAVLSKSWDPVLDDETRGLAERLRAIHARIHLGFVLAGGFSLAFGVAVVLQSLFPIQDWSLVVLGSAVAALVSFGVLVESLVRRRRVHRLIAR